MNLEPARPTPSVGALAPSAAPLTLVELPAPLTLVELPAPLATPEAFLAAATGPDGTLDTALLYAPPTGPALAGVGIAATLTAGPTFTADARALLAALAVTGAATPRFVGALPFAPDAQAGPEWDALGAGRFILPRWLYRTDGTRATVTIAARTGDAHARAALAPVLTRLAAAPAAPAHRPARAQVTDDDAAGFRARVRAILELVAAGRLAKAVAARRVRLLLAAPLAPAALLGQLAKTQPGCTRFALLSSGVCFLGATPELLVRRRGLTVETEALAGSIAVSAAGHAAQLALSEKDLREHAHVVGALAAGLAPRCTALDVAATPHVRTLPGLAHLATAITGRLAAPAHIVDLALALHPTPATSGVPAAAALELVARTEPWRGLYAGPFGWFDADGDGEFVVALRSGRFCEREAELYAGAGIVAGSDPDREFDETTLKLGALLGALEGVLDGELERA